LRDEDRVCCARFAFATSAAGKKKPDGKNLPGTQAIVCAISWLFAFLSIRGWFYKDRFIGSEPNEKLKKKLKKKPKVIQEDAPPLPPPASLLL